MIVSRSESNKYKPLYGLTGTLYVHSGQRKREDEKFKERAFFSRHAESRTGDIAKDVLKLDKLFWLAVGCLPTPTPSNRILCLEDVEIVKVIPDTPPPVRPTASPSPAAAWNPRAAGHVSFDNDDDYPTPLSSDDGFQYTGYQPNTSPAMFVSPQMVDPNLRVSVPNANEPRAFRFSLWNGRVDALSDLARIVQADTADVEVYSLEEISLTTAEVDELQLNNANTYIPRASLWTRIGETRHYAYSWFLRRTDAQQLTYAILALPLHPQGYLISAKSTECKKFLCRAADSLPQLLTRTIWGIDSLGLGDLVTMQVLNALNGASDATEPVTATRRYFEAMYNLDQALDSAILHASEQDKRVCMMVGVLMITSSEFRSLITQSARMIAEAAHATLEIDFDTKTINVASVLNHFCRFPIDTDAIFDGTDLSKDVGQIQISLAQVLPMCQKAALRSALLETSLDSSPLFQAVVGMEDVVYMG